MNEDHRNENETLIEMEKPILSFPWYICMDLGDGCFQILFGLSKTYETYSRY